MMSRLVLSFVLSCACVISLVATTSYAAVLEVPSEDSELSGVLFTSGWKCPPTGDITVQFDDLEPLKVATKIQRGDTSGACGNSGNNGFIAQFNYNILPEAAAAAAEGGAQAATGRTKHTAVAYDDGVEFARSDFYVTSLGGRFLRGVDGTFLIEDFPFPGESVVVEWKQSIQGFVFTEHNRNAVDPLERLLGTWRFTYTIISTFVNEYTLDEIRQTTDGLRAAVGTSDIGNPAAASLVSEFDTSGVFDREYILIDFGIIGCEAFLFDLINDGAVIGEQYTLLGSDCGTLIGSGNAMTGVRLSAAAAAAERPYLAGEFAPWRASELTRNAMGAVAAANQN